MSNPLIKPNDPRFQRPAITDEEGKNRFADASSPAADQTEIPTSVFTASSAAENPYQPRYETTASARGMWLLVLAVIGLAGVSLGMSSLSGLFVVGWLLPLCSVAASATAWLLGHSDLQAMNLGAMDDSGRALTRIATWLGIVGLIMSLAAVAAMIWLGISVLPLFL